MTVSMFLVDSLRHATGRRNFSVGNEHDQMSHVIFGRNTPVYEGTVLGPLIPGGGHHRYTLRKPGQDATPDRRVVTGGRNLLYDSLLHDVVR